MRTEQLTAESLKSGYGLPGEIAEIQRTYPLLFAVPRDDGVYSYAVDTMGVLYVLCDKCREQNRLSRKPIGPLERLNAGSGTKVRASCGHLTYIPSMKEVRRHAGVNLEAQTRTFLANRKRKIAKAAQPRRTPRVLALTGLVIMVTVGLLACIGGIRCARSERVSDSHAKPLMAALADSADLTNVLTSKGEDRESVRRVVAMLDDEARRAGGKSVLLARLAGGNILSVLPGGRGPAWGEELDRLEGQPLESLQATGHAVGGSRTGDPGLRYDYYILQKDVEGDALVLRLQR